MIALLADLDTWRAVTVAVFILAGTYVLVQQLHAGLVDRQASRIKADPAGDPQRAKAKEQRAETLRKLASIRNPWVLTLMVVSGFARAVLVFVS